MASPCTTINPSFSNPYFWGKTCHTIRSFSVTYYWGTITTQCHGNANCKTPRKAYSFTRGYLNNVCTTPPAN